MYHGGGGENSRCAKLVCQREIVDGRNQLLLWELISSKASMSLLMYVRNSLADGLHMTFEIRLSPNVSLSRFRLICCCGRSHEQHNMKTITQHFQSLHCWLTLTLNEYEIVFVSYFYQSMVRQQTASWVAQLRSNNPLCNRCSIITLTLSQLTAQRGR